MPQATVIGWLSANVLRWFRMVRRGDICRGSRFVRQKSEVVYSIGFVLFAVGDNCRDSILSF
ncbi:MAG: hypothetical protein C0485_05315 [Pirellula sp.]|nr:hypothetical protein [Pirellula sp.]